jgi:hypothetical protein
MLQEALFQPPLLLLEAERLSQKQLAFLTGIKNQPHFPLRTRAY